jgi:uncharacterized membrane protein YesL
MAIFTADSTLMRVLSRVADVMLLNLLFVATSLPILTLGASLTALCSTAMRIVRGRCDSVTGDYVRAFRQNARQGSVLATVLVALAGVLAAWYVVVTTFVASPVGQLLLLAVWFVLAFQLALVALFAFPYLASFQDPTARVLRNARLLAWAHPVTALGVIMLVGLPVVITIFYPRLTVYGLLWLAIGFGAIAVLTGMLFTRIFDKYTPTPSPDDAIKDGTARALT